MLDLTICQHHSVAIGGRTLYFDMKLLSSTLANQAVSRPTSGRSG
jgi:hypothetical protein